MRIGIDEALQAIYQACVLEMMGGAPEEAFAEQRFLAFVADDMSTDEVGSGGDAAEARFNPVRCRGGIGIGREQDGMWSADVQGPLHGEPPRRTDMGPGRRKTYIDDVESQTVVTRGRPVDDLRRMVITIVQDNDYVQDLVCRKQPGLLC